MIKETVQRFQADSAGPGGRAVLVAGVGSTGCGVFPDRDAIHLGADALSLAIEDWGMPHEALDAVITVRIPLYERLVQGASVNPRFAFALPAEGRMAAVALQLAASLIRTGAARSVACVYGNDGRSRGAIYGGSAKSVDGPDAFWMRHGMTSPGAAHAMMFAQHMAQYGTPPAALETVATTFRTHAAQHPQAFMREPLDGPSYAASPFIAQPLRRHDYCVIADGGMALILADGSAVRASSRPPVFLRAAGVQASLLDADIIAPDYWLGPMRKLAADTFAAAGMQHDDVDALMIYDNFTPTVLFSLEGFGYCEPGGSGHWVREGHLGMNGRYPANTSGGHLSEGYMQGWGLLVEAVRQIRGEAAGRQVVGCETVHFMCASPICGSIILSSRT